MLPIHHITKEKIHETGKSVQRTQSEMSDTFWTLLELSSSVSPHGRIQSDSFRAVELHIQQDHTDGAVFTAHKYAVVHIIHKIEVPGQPVNGHLLHIYKTQTEVSGD